MLEHADEERSGSLGQRRRRHRELLEIHVGREVVGRLDTELANEAGRERRNRADRVGAAQRGCRNGIADAGDKPPRA